MAQFPISSQKLAQVHMKSTSKFRACYVALNVMRVCNMITNVAGGWQLHEVATLLTVHVLFAAPGHKAILFQPGATIISRTSGHPPGWPPTHRAEPWLNVNPLDYGIWGGIESRACLSGSPRWAMDTSRRRIHKGTKAIGKTSPGFFSHVGLWFLTIPMPLTNPYSSIDIHTLTFL